MNYDFGDFDGGEVRVCEADAVGSRRNADVRAATLAVGFKGQSRPRSNGIQLHPNAGDGARFSSTGALGANVDQQPPATGPLPGGGRRRMAGEQPYDQHPHG